MILADTSVWIDYLRGTGSPAANEVTPGRSAAPSGRHDKQRPRPIRPGSMETSQPAERTISRSH
jgi:hypothetical protein